MITEKTIAQRKALKKPLTEIAEATDSIIETMQNAPAPHKNIHYRALDHTGKSNVTLTNNIVVESYYRQDGKLYRISVIRWEDSK